MQWDLNLICEALKASFEKVSDIYMLEFKDNNSKFNLQIQPENETIMFASDPIQPVTAMPLFEYSCKCNIIKVIDSPYFSETKAIYFYEDNDLNDGVRLALNLRPDGNWYIWCNAWRRQ